MALPFDIPERNKRKWQCFCCGVEFKEWEEFKAHVTDNHEEGREYIVCPLEHCEAPVRDMKAHFAHRHAAFPLPKTGMMRALIWKDFSPKHQKGKTRKPKFREGYYDSVKMKKAFHYRSGYECTVFEVLDQDIEVNSFDVEPFKIPYLHRGKSHSYTPDLIVHFLDGSTKVYEIKPSNQTTLEKNQDKWHYCNKACQTRGWEFQVLTEKGIDLWKQKIKNQKINEGGNTQ